MRNKPEEQFTGDTSGNEFLFSIDLLFNHKYPRLAAYISLVLFGFGGVGQLLLGQENKAGVLLAVDGLVVFPIGILSGSLPYFLLGFHLFTALDAWVIAGRRISGRKIGKWEWFRHGT